MTSSSRFIVNWPQLKPSVGNERKHAQHSDCDYSIATLRTNAVSLSLDVETKLSRRLAVGKQFLAMNFENIAVALLNPPPRSWILFILQVGQQGYCFNHLACVQMFTFFLAILHPLSSRVSPHGFLASDWPSVCLIFCSWCTLSEYNSSTIQQVLLSWLYPSLFIVLFFFVAWCALTINHKYEPPFTVDQISFFLLITSCMSTNFCPLLNPIWLTISLYNVPLLLQLYLICAWAASCPAQRRLLFCLPVVLHSTSRQINSKMWICFSLLSFCSSPLHLPPAPFPQVSLLLISFFIIAVSE